MKSRPVLIFLFFTCVSLCALALSFATDPSNLRADGIPTNAHILKLNPSYCWDLPVNETSINYQVQVDDDPNFSGVDATGNCLSAPFFWDSGITPGNIRCVTHRSGTTCGSGSCSTYPGYLFCNADLEFRPILLYWRVRTESAAGVWSNWVSTSEKLNFPPLWPITMSAAVNAVASTDTVQTDPNTVASPGTYYVAYLDPNAADDPNHGTSTEPWNTLQYATSQLVAGDTLNVVEADANGPYPGNIVIKSASGTAMHPITVQANSGDTPYIVSGGTVLTLQSVHDWVISGIRAATTSGSGNAIVLNNVDNVVVTGFSIPSGYTPSWQANNANESNGILIQNSRGVRILDSVFDQSISDAIDFEGSTDLTVQGNEFTTAAYDPNTMTIHHFLHLHPGARGNVLVDSNYFHDANAGKEAAIYNYKGAFARYTNNVFYNLGGHSDNNNNAVLAVRSGPFQFINNTCYDVQDACVVSSMGTGYVTFSSNIVAHSDPNGSYAGRANAPRGIVFGAADSQLGTTTRGSIVDYNDFFHMNTATADNIVYDPRGGTAVTQAAQLAHAATGNITSDPNFVSVDPNDIATDFLRLDAGSAALDPNDNGLPVPTLGGNFRDMGRFERGETNNTMYKIYTYQAEVASLMDATPKFSWELRDEDNLLDTCCDFLPAGDTDFQKKFQLQIDEATTFDTLSAAHPLIDSGVITSSTQSWTVPDSRVLDRSKKYYFRVRQSDDEDPNNLGPWSDATFAISMDADSEPADPIITSQNPDTDETGVACSPLQFSFVVHDEGSTMDCDTVTLPNTSMIMVLDGGIDQNGNGWNTDPVGTARADCTYTKDSFLSSGAHTFRFQVCDQEGSPNCVDTGTYTFTCGNASPPATPGGPRIYKVVD